MKISTLLATVLATCAAGFQSTGFVTTKDDTKIFYRESGNASGQPIVFSHGWPLTGDNWNAQMFALGQQGYRVIAHDRRGFGYSAQPWLGNDMDTYADDLYTLFLHLELKDVMMVGHSTGGGEVARFLGRHGTERVSKAVFIDSVIPILVNGTDNPTGVPVAFFDEFRYNYTLNRAQFFLDFASGPFFGYNLAGANVSEGIIQDWMQQAFKSGFKNAYDCTIAFSQTDFTEDLKSLDIPALILHGELDQ